MHSTAVCVCVFQSHKQDRSIQMDKMKKRNPPVTKKYMKAMAMMVTMTSTTGNEIVYAQVMKSKTERKENE